MQSIHKASEAPQQCFGDQAIAAIKLKLSTEYCVEEMEIPLYLRGLRAYNEGRSLNKPYVPKGKISFEEFDEKENLYKQARENLEKEKWTNDYIIHQLAAFDAMTYELHSLHPIDAAKFYADIAQLLNELNDLLKAKAEAARHGSNTYEVNASRAVGALFL